MQIKKTKMDTFDLEKAAQYYEEENNITKATKQHCKELGIEYTEKYRHRLSRFLRSDKYENSDDEKDKDLDTSTETETNQYSNDKEKVNHFSAIGEDGKLMNIDVYCDHYNLDIDKIKSWKLVSHTGVPFYNIAFFDNVVESTVTEEELKVLIQEGLKDVAPINKKEIYNKDCEGVGVIKIADLHLGAYIEGLIRTKEFSINILAQKLRKAVKEINKRAYETVHIHLQGDIIESFTGLSHKNTWKGLDKAMVGAEAVKLACKILHKDFLQLINNLGEIKLVAGNHDRVTSDNKEDVQGDAANLVGWGLELMGYSVEFNPLVITHEVGGICHILTHGHHPISKKSTKQLCWDYGVQGKFNLISEGHLHSIIEKLSLKQQESFQVIKDDAVDHRRMNCPSFFTGNFYSESLGYTSQSGFVIIEDNGEGIPNVFYYAV